MDDNFYLLDQDFDLEAEADYDEDMDALVAFNPEDEEDLMLAQRPPVAIPPAGGPGYGRPPVAIPPAGGPGYGRPPAGGPGYGRPPFGRPPYGRPGYGRPPVGRPGYDQSRYRRGSGYPASPPPSYVPRKPYPYRNPYPLRQCLYGFDYLWMDDGSSFWARLTNIYGHVVQGYRWDGYRWINFTANTSDIENYVCL